MATNKNFEVKNGLTIAGTERITSAGVFTGSLASATTATTQSATDNSTKIATTAYTDAAITAVIGGAPGTLDTLNELAAAINDDASYASTLTTALATKLPLAGGTMTGDLILGDNVKVEIGSASGGDLQLYHDGGNSYIKSTTGWLNMPTGGNGISIANSDFTEQLAKFQVNGSVELYHNGSKKLETESGGVKVTDGLTVDTGTTNGAEVSIISTNTANAGANNPTLKLYRSGVLSGGFGQGGLLEFAGQNASGTEKTYATISGDIFDTTASSEDGYLTFKTMQSGTLTAAMEIDHQGHVGINTTTPATFLHIKADSNSTTDYPLTIENAANSLDLGIGAYGFSNTVGTSQGSDFVYNVGRHHIFEVDGNEKVRFDEDGNVGIGNASPSAHHPDFRSIQLGAGGSGISGGATGNRNINLSNNTYLSSSGSWKYVAADHAANIEMYDGTMHFKVAPSGSANATVSWNEAMTIVNTGRVGIGTNNPGAKLEISGKDDEGATDLLRLIFDNSPADTGITFTDINSTIKNRISMDSSNTNDLYISTGTEMKFFCGTTGTSTTQVMHLKKINSSISSVHVGNGVIGPSSDITYTAQGHGENWRWGANVGNGNAYFLASGNNGVYMGTSSNSWSSHSDERLKENITPLGEVLPSLLNMRCVKFNRKGDSGNTKVGFIAQDWEGKGFDEVVDEDTGFTIQDDGTLKSVVEEDNTSTTNPKSIAYTETIPVLLKAMQEQQTIIEDLKSRIETLEG